MQPTVRGGAMALERTALHSRHLAAGARMMPFARYEMPLQYSSLKAEALAVRQGCGIFDVSHMGQFLLTGPDAVACMDYLICNDFAGAEVGRAVYSPLLQADGTLVDDLIAYKLGREKVLVCVNGANIKKDWKWLGHQGGGFRVQWADRSQEFSLLAVQGPQSPRALASLGVEVPKNFPSYSVTESQWRDWSMVLARTGYTGEDGFELFCPHSAAVALWEELLASGMCPCGLGARDVLRIEAGYPLYGQELSEQLTPLDVGLGWTVKMGKKTFVGKDSLSRYTPRFRMIKLTLDRGIPRPGHEVLNSSGQGLGQVTSGTLSVVLNQGVGMARVARERAVTQKLLVKIRERYYDGHLHHGSFVGGKKNP